MTNTTKEIFFNSRSEARKSGQPVKDAGENSPFGTRWYIEMQVNQVLQEIFDNGARHLLTQNAKSLSSGGKCFYRGEQGRMCAAGPFIANVHYKASLENRSIRDSGVQLALKKSGFPFGVDGAYNILTGLQVVHDASNVTTWARELKKIAARFNLSSEVVDNFLVPIK